MYEVICLCGYFHCSDGCGRSGTFLSVYSAIDRFKVEAVVDVFQCVKAARIQRMALVANVVSTGYTLRGLTRPPPHTELYQHTKHARLSFCGVNFNTSIVTMNVNKRP